jgi:hypothetical protein
MLVQVSWAQVVAVEPTEKGFLYSTAPTMTFLWPARQARAVLIFIPGGEGRLGLKEDRRNIGGFYGNALRPLSDETRTSGSFHVVVFDSPQELSSVGAYPSSRSTPDHLMRIDSVVRHYQQKFNLPIWLMGHSNGAVSLVEYYGKLVKAGQASRLQGLVYSSARNGAFFPAETHTPVLFLAHEKDGCDKSTLSNARKVQAQLLASSPVQTDFVLVQGGEAENASPCRSGFHMYHGAEAEAFQAIDRFATTLLGPLAR